MNLIATLKRLFFIFTRKERLNEYKSYLEYAISKNYSIVSLNDWVSNFNSKKEEGTKTVVLRHDVDHDPLSALKMSNIERSVGVTSTFYFRWSTCDRNIIALVKNNGSSVGLHYETITREAYQNGYNNKSDITSYFLENCKKELKKEISVFKRIAKHENVSIVAHGDKIVSKIETTNNLFFRFGNNNKNIYERFEILFDSSEPSLLNSFDFWVSDSDGFRGYWTSEHNFNNAIDGGYKVILFNTHPHHWTIQRKAIIFQLLEQIAFFIKKPRFGLKCGAGVFAWLKFKDLIF